MYLMAKNLKFVTLQSFEGSHTRSRSDAKQLSTLLCSSVSGEKLQAQKLKWH